MGDDKTIGEVRFEDIGMGWLVRYQHTGHWLDFQAYECVAHRDMTDPTWEYRKKGELNDFTPIVEEAEVVIDGFVKWDGCAEMKLDQPHFCGAQSVAEFAEVMKRLHALAKLLPSVDYDCAGYPEPASETGGDSR